MIRTLTAAFFAMLMCVALGVAPVSAQSNGGCKKKGGQVVGAVVGGVLGGILGNKIDGGRKRGVGTVLGAVAGALAGSALGKKLDKCEQQKVEAATYTAVNDAPAGTPTTWKSDTRDDVHGTVVAAPAVRTADGRQCRLVTRVSYIAGEEVREQPRMCRTPPQNDWQVA